jgi:glycosyltransferase involved in cell wall biosynthesis
MQTPVVLHLSTSGSGGAGIAAKRLNQGFNSMGVNSKFISLPGKSPEFAKNESPINRGNLLTLQSVGLTLIENHFSTKTFFSPVSLNVIKVNEIVENYDSSKTVIHIHNWFNLLNLDFIAKLVEKGFRIVFTLHDQRLMTGGCHYSLHCTLYKSGCELCPELSPIIAKLPSKVHKKEEVILRKIQQSCVLIAPSKWMSDMARESTHLREFETRIIPNFIPELSNEVHEEQVIRIQKRDKITLGVASENPYSYIKGGALIKSLESDSEFLSRYRLIFMKNYSDHNDFWKELDFLLVPSINDNSPNVISEAKIRSIPVIASAVGGIPELMCTEFDELVELTKLSAAYLVGNFEKLFCKLSDSHSKELSKVQFDKHKKFVLEKHLKVYSDLLNSG